MASNNEQHFTEAAEELLKTPDGYGARVVSLRSGYDPLELRVIDHPYAIATINKILKSAPAGFDTDKLYRKLFYRNDSGDLCLAKGPALYELVTENPDYYIRRTDWACIDEPSRLGAPILFDPPGTVCVDCGAGGGEKRALRIKLTARARQIAIIANNKTRKENLRRTKIGQQPLPLKSVPEVPKVIVLVDISQQFLRQAEGNISQMLEGLPLNYEVIYGDNLERKKIKSSNRGIDVSLILLEQNFMDSDFFSRNQMLQAIVRSTLERRNIPDWSWRFEMLGGTFHNMDVQQIDFFIGNMAQLFEKPEGPEQSKGRERFLVGLDFTTALSVTNQCYDIPEFKIWSAMAFYRSIIRLGYAPFDLSAFDIKVENTSCLPHLKASLPALDWQAASEDAARAIRTEFRAQSAITLKPTPGAKRLPLDLIHVHTEAITRYSQGIWAKLFGRHEMRVGSAVTYPVTKNEPAIHFAVAEYSKVASAKPPAPGG